MSDEPRVIYFDIRGRAEPIRMLLEEVGVEYANDHADSEWMTRRQDTPFGVLPIYEKGAVQVPESQAILRHLARVHDLYGDTEDERVRCDPLDDQDPPSPVPTLGARSLPTSCNSY